jgi:biotin operon repressor
MRLPLLSTRVPPLAIATFVNERGAAYSGEILDEFLISESTLRKRRPELRRLGIHFVERGRGSFYAVAGLTSQLPNN